jgi:glycosyltransferase involved in cell wall biosynthesis
VKKKLFVISSRVPYPLDKGDKLRLYHQLRYLSNDFEIMLVSLDETNEQTNAPEKLKYFTNHFHIIKLSKIKIYLNVFLGIFGRKPFQVYYFHQHSAHKKVRTLIEDFKPDFIYSQLLRSAEYVKDYHYIPKTIDYQDAFSKGIERRIDKAGWRKPIFESEHKRLLKYENLIFDYFEHHTIISEEDRNAIFHEKRGQISIIPNGIDTSFFQRDLKVKKKYDLLFVGNMSYAPNVDAAQYIANDLLPELLKTTSNIKILIAGSNPSQEVLNLANNHIIVSGWIDDIRTAYNESKIFIAPMQLGSGLQNKLLEAMSMELPCITSKLANKSLKAENGKQALICETVTDYVDAYKQLVNNENSEPTIAVQGRIFVKHQFSWEKSVKELSALIQR